MLGSVLLEMTEGSATRMKRNGARHFKNPPQPHMCIQDFIRGTSTTCYINVLSWDKVARPCRPTQPVPLYGGMRVTPPRTEADAIVFAVMANPEVLRINGKNAQDPKKRSILIELLLDFIEAMNTGVVFSRHYTILKDRDITGELKEVWNAVQARRDREQPPQQHETWIDAQPPVPQYPQYQEQQQQQSQQQQQQQEYPPQPPQYHSSVAYGRTIPDGVHYETYGPHTNPIIPQNDQMYQAGQVVPQQYHGNVPRMPQDRYNYRERGRDNLVPNMPQQTCPAYPAPQYQFQQLPRQMVPQYVNSNVHPNTGMSYGPAANTNVNPSMNANLPAPFQPYMTYQQRMDNTMHVDIRRMQQQQQQQQQQPVHLNHVQPVPQYEPVAQFNVQTTSALNVLARLGRLQAVTQKNNTGKRQINSPTHSKQQNCNNCQNKDSQDNGTKPKSPVKVLQRESSDRQENNSRASAEKVTDEKNAQVTDLDEEVTSNEAEGTETESKKLNDVQNSTSNEEDGEKQPEKAVEKSTQEEEDTVQSSEKNSKTKIIVIKGKHKENAEGNKAVRARLADQKTESPKRLQTTVNSIFKSVLKIHPGASGEETSGRRKTNGQAKRNDKSNENDEPQPGYTILKKTESITQEEVTNEIAQISIQDCNDAAEVSPVLS